MNQMVILLGNIGSNGELKYMADGTALMNFSLATNRKTGGEDHTTWWRITVWGQLAQTFADKDMVRKGLRAQVIGEMISDKESGGPRVYETNSGEHRASYEVRGNNVKILFDRGGDQPNTGNARPSSDEIPF